jgi:pyruvate kinase
MTVPGRPAGRRGVKLVCTLGPATATIESIRALAATATNVFRVNLSHGDADARRHLVELVRAVAQERGEDPAVMMDLPGPKIRLGALGDGEAKLEVGARFELRPDGAEGNGTGASTTYPGLAGDVRPGDRILLSDGAVELTVVSAEGSIVACEVVRAGRIRSGAGVNVPAERLSRRGSPIAIAPEFRRR